ncbi:hypothetical protein LTR10_018081 [Elasticomyces elasticus]|uniref:Heterokaryon incompatibility domain-containing protein n=1 Tax=Exophiala sideris TaxID=1016849 RepID=A0ABR0JPH5_9EURO|nr:hypothetical protein LTR10_018081 [Elasticomyces elasticus]KAK5039516.1 hypothetical protein LTS07_000010 [Exophiala sideris]KAK5041069.1 hypothetical protein LTR13_002543 [Exophiala sideris]KAK5067893.1 hypothetical protein LTR69_000010 [Exophiala sideris]KAK5187195.1 hypothetical protein LTR44_000010 [Eurotiomycetes sp. CCFEE 6388]
MEWASRQLAPPDQVVASALKRVRKDNHSVCTEEACVFNRADTKEYHTRHVPDDCTCRHVTEAQIISSQQKDCSPTTIADAAASLLQKDLLPIYTVQKGLVEVSSIVMSSADTPTTYVAISHVWSDGLGNPEFNSLPLCQLIRLQRLVDELYPDMPMDRHVPFWIDTLSVPVKPPTARSSAISKMRETYQKAAKVLVLDAELMSLDIFVPPLELALRVACAGWANRLWTYQEAVLSQDLVYRFRNGFVSQKELQVGYIDNWARNAYSGITTAGQRALQMFTIERDREEIERGFKLHFVAEALRWRTTTKEEDEAVCLGTICGVDVTAMLKLKTAKERMNKFYQSLDFIPWGLLFSWGSKINQRGFTWAPASFLNRTTMLPRTSKSKGATWSINGLLGRGPGILFSDFGVAHDLRSFFFKDHNTQRWFLVYPVYPFADEDENIPTPYGKTFQKRKTGKAPFDVKRPFTTALLLFDPIERVDTGTNAVYVHIKSLSSGIAGESLIHVSYDEPVNIHTVDKSVLIGHMGQAMVQNFEQPGSTFFEDGLARHGLSVPSTTSWCIE